MSKVLAHPGRKMQDESNLSFYRSQKNNTMHCEEALMEDMDNVIQQGKATKIKIAFGSWGEGNAKGTLGKVANDGWMYIWTNSKNQGDPERKECGPLTPELFLERLGPRVEGPEVSKGIGIHGRGGSDAHTSISEFTTVIWTLNDKVYSWNWNGRFYSTHKDMPGPPVCEGPETFECPDGETYNFGPGNPGFLVLWKDMCEIEPRAATMEQVLRKEYAPWIENGGQLSILCPRSEDYDIKGNKPRREFQLKIKKGISLRKNLESSFEVLQVLGRSVPKDLSGIFYEKGHRRWKISPTVDNREGLELIIKLGMTPSFTPNNKGAFEKNAKIPVEIERRILEILRKNSQGKLFLDQGTPIEIPGRDARVGKNIVRLFQKIFGFPPVGIGPGTHKQLICPECKKTTSDYQETGYGPKKLYSKPVGKLILLSYYCNNCLNEWTIERKKSEGPRRIHHIAPGSIFFKYEERPGYNKKHFVEVEFREGYDLFIYDPEKCDYGKWLKTERFDKRPVSAYKYMAIRACTQLYLQRQLFCPSIEEFSEKDHEKIEETLREKRKLWQAGDQNFLQQFEELGHAIVHSICINDKRTKATNKIITE